MLTPATDYFVIEAAISPRVESLSQNIKSILLVQAAAVAGKPEPFVTALGWVLCIAQVDSTLEIGGLNFAFKACIYSHVKTFSWIGLLSLVNFRTSKTRTTSSRTARCIWNFSSIPCHTARSNNTRRS